MIEQREAWKHEISIDLQDIGKCYLSCVVCVSLLVLNRESGERSIATINIPTNLAPVFFFNTMNFYVNLGLAMGCTPRHQISRPRPRMQKIARETSIRRAARKVAAAGFF